MRNKNEPKYIEICIIWDLKNASDVDQMNLKETNYDFNEIFFTQNIILPLYKKYICCIR
jgi:hypothetical protein